MANADRPASDLSPDEGLRLLRAFVRLDRDARAALIRAAEEQVEASDMDGEIDVVRVLASRGPATGS